MNLVENMFDLTEIDWAQHEMAFYERQLDHYRENPTDASWERLVLAEKSVLNAINVIAEEKVRAALLAEFLGE